MAAAVVGRAEAAPGDKVLEAAVSMVQAAAVSSQIWKKCSSAAKTG